MFTIKTGKNIYRTQETTQKTSYKNHKTLRKNNK